MKTRICNRLGLLAAGILIFSGMGMAAEFSADLVQTGKNVNNRGRLYVKGDKIREEISEGIKQIVIERRDKELVWSIYPNDKIYMVVTDAIIRGIDDPRARERFKSLSTTIPATKETLNGYMCTKRVWKLKKDPNTTMTEWKADKLDFIIKIVMKRKYDERVIEYKNIKPGPVPDSMFELPAGYTPVTPPSPG